MPVVVYQVLHGLQRNVYDVVDILEAFVRNFLATCLLQVKSKVVDAPFTAMFLVVLFSVFLNSYICQMHHHVTEFGLFGTVFFVAETGEAEGAEPYL